MSLTGARSYFTEVATLFAEFWDTLEKPGAQRLPGALRKHRPLLRVENPRRGEANGLNPVTVSAL